MSLLRRFKPVLIASVAAVAGCGKPIITADDVLMAPGQPARFVMSLDREIGKASVVGAPVEFLVNGRRIGSGRTDSNGVAAITAPIEGAPNTYTVRATLDQEVIHGQGRIFQWDGSRTAVAVDVDETISATDYGSLFLTALDTTSPPIEYSPQAVQAMASRYSIVYLSARPRWLHEKTKVWLSAHGFPPGPILHASRFEACMHQERYKREMLAEFQRSFPNLLIGVGDKGVDDRAYGDNRMLAVILETGKASYRDHCVVFPDWRQIERFFNEHHDSLTDAAQLQRFIHSNGMKLRPHFESDQAYASAESAGAATPPAVTAPGQSRRAGPVAKAQPPDPSGPEDTRRRGDWVYGYQ